MAMVITGKKFQQQVGSNDVVYVNLGNAQGVKVGDYFRIFRYTGHGARDRLSDPVAMLSTSKAIQGPTYGFGWAPKKYDWSNVPREVLGEGVVLRTGPIPRLS